MNSFKLHYFMARPQARALTATQVRAFGGYVPDPNHKYEYRHSETRQTTLKMPSPGDLGYQAPKHGTLDEKLAQWIAGRWAVDRDDELDNTKVNKYSAYHVLGTQAV